MIPLAYDSQAYPGKEYSGQWVQIRRPWHNTPLDFGIVNHAYAYGEDINLLISCIRPPKPGSSYSYVSIQAKADVCIPLCEVL